MLPDLFGDAVLPGLVTADDLVSTEEEAALIAGIDAAPLAPFRFQGWIGKRLTVSYGRTYDFDSARFADRLIQPLSRKRERGPGLQRASPISQSRNACTSLDIGFDLSLVSQ